MGRYPNPVDSTRDTFRRRVAELVMVTGLGALAGLAFAEDVAAAWWIVFGVVATGGFLDLCRDEWRLRRIDNRAWTSDQWEDLRDREYHRRQGVFLVHSATECDPPEEANNTSKQYFLVTLRLVQHREGPLSWGKVKEVEYGIPPTKFTEVTGKSNNESSGFAWSTEAHGSLMVLGRVHFKNPLARPLMVERYVELPPFGWSSGEQKPSTES